MSASVCSSCSAPVIWAKTPRGANTPLDVEPVAGGNIDLRAGLAIIVTPEPGVRRFRSHFVSCPSRDKHRKPRPRKEPPAPPPPESKALIDHLRERARNRHGGR